MIEVVKVSDEGFDVEFDLEEMEWLCVLGYIN